MNLRHTYKTRLWYLPGVFSNISRHFYMESLSIPPGVAHIPASLLRTGSLTQKKTSSRKFWDDVKGEVRYLTPFNSIDFTAFFGNTRQLYHDNDH